MKIQANLEKTAKYYPEQSFTANRLKLKDLKHISRTTTDFSRSSSAINSKGDYAQFIKDFESKYIDRNKAVWEYMTSNNLWTGLKSYIKIFNYDIFINKKENRENYCKLYGQQDIKFENLFVRFANFLKMLSNDIFWHRAEKKVLKTKGIIDGKKVSQDEISKIILNDKNPELREKACNAKFKIGDSLVNYVTSIVKKRNSLAQNLKHNSYFDFLLNKNYKTNAEAFNNNLNKTYSALKPKFEKVFEETNNSLKNIFQTNQLEHYHYDLRICSEEYKILDEIVAKYGALSLAKKIYSKMGFDLDKLINEGKLIFYEDKSKKRAFHKALMPGKLSAICTEQSNNFYNLLTMCHELGHAMYNLGLSESLPLCMKKSTSIIMNEAIAIMMSNIVLDENMLTDIVPADILEKVKKNRHQEQLIKLAKFFAITEFEQEMYSNPNQDLAKLWQEKFKKYTGRNYAASNEWATFDYFISSPARVHNYIKATLAADQLHKILKEKLGNFSDYKEVAKYLNENIFSKGASLSESELLKEIAGKELSFEDFVENL